MTDIERKMISETSVFETKGIEGFEIKDADRGEVVAIVSTMNVVDRDGDVVLPGAIKDGSVVKLSSYEHDVITEGKAPVGRGVISIQGNQAVMKGRYFMSTARGRDAFNTVKEMGGDSEWSIGFSRQVKTAEMTQEWKSKGANRLIAGLTLLESSPVFMGANGQTATVSAKAAASDIVEVPVDEDEATKAIAQRSDTTPQEGMHQYGDVHFADPTNKKYPIDTEEHIRAAWSYINQADNAAKYTAAEVEAIKSHIITAWKHMIDSAGPPSAKSVRLAEVRLELETAEARVAELKSLKANLEAGEIFDRIQRNMQRMNA